VSTVILRHPTLPSDQEIEVDAAALPHYTGAGWQQVPADELERRAALKAQAKAEAEAAAAEETAQAAEPADEPEQSEPAEPTDRPARSRTKTAAKKSEEES
jgi:hypothetical protein